MTSPSPPSPRDIERIFLWRMLTWSCKIELEDNKKEEAELAKLLNSHKEEASQSLFNEEKIASIIFGYSRSLPTRVLQEDLKY